MASIVPTTMETRHSAIQQFSTIASNVCVHGQLERIKRHNTMNHTILDQQHREFWGGLAHEMKPEFWFTFNYVRPYNDRTSLEGFKFVTKAMQRKIPSRRTIRGMACLERTWKNAHFEGCLHMHSLLCGVDASFRNPDAYITDLAYKSVLLLTDWKGRPMADTDTIDIQRVYEPERVIKYATKDLNRSDIQRKTKICLIRPDGLDVTFANINLN